MTDTNVLAVVEVQINDLRNGYRMAEIIAEPFPDGLIASGVVVGQISLEGRVRTDRDAMKCFA